MPIVLLLVALLTGAVGAAIWFALGGSLLGSFLVYVLSGNLAMGALLARIAFRGPR